MFFQSEVAHSTTNNTVCSEIWKSAIKKIFLENVDFGHLVGDGTGGNTLTYTYLLLHVIFSYFLSTVRNVTTKRAKGKQYVEGLDHYPSERKQYQFSFRPCFFVYLFIHII